MNKSPKREEYLSIKSLFKGAIRFLLFRYGNLTAKQIQKKFRLKRQTTYNYLKELVEEGAINIKYEKIETRSNLSVAYYSFNRQQLLTRNDQLITETIKKESEFQSSRSVERMKNAVDSSIGALLEIKSAFNDMTNEEIENFVKCDPNVWGFFSLTYLLTDDEYKELIIEMKKIVNKFDKKESNQHNHQGNVFTFAFYKALP
ncbi:MAG: hypothetical protein ACFFFH_16545 [Candidatus Thorarchaeota archaeon]